MDPTPLSQKLGVSLDAVAWSKPDTVGLTRGSNVSNNIKLSSITTLPSKHILEGTSSTKVPIAQSLSPVWHGLEALSPAALHNERTSVSALAE